MSIAEAALTRSSRSIAPGLSCPQRADLHECCHPGQLVLGQQRQKNLADVITAVAGSPTYCQRAQHFSQLLAEDCSGTAAGIITAHLWTHSATEVSASR